MRRGVRRQPNRLFSQGTACLFALGLIGGTLATAVPSGASTAVTLYVASGGSDIGSCTSSSTPCGTVSYAVTQATSGDTIEVSGTILDNVTISPGFGTLTITNWPGQNPAVLDGAPRGSNFRVLAPVVMVSSGDTLDLMGETLQHGGAGGVENEAGIVNFTNVTVLGDGCAGAVGGGIYTRAGTVNVTNSTITGNQSCDSGGGGIHNSNDGTVNVTGSTITGNSTPAGMNGGGIDNESGTVDVADSTITGNTSGSDGGGIFNSGTASITATTIAANTAYGVYGGGIDNNGTLLVGASILVSNHAEYSYAPDCVLYTGSFTDPGYNLTSPSVSSASCPFTQSTDVLNANADLGPLANNGGPTETMLPQPGSPAIGRIPVGTNSNGTAVCGGPAADQRGVTRPQSGAANVCTIGSVEVPAYPPQFTSTASATFTAGQPGSFQVTSTGSPTPTFTEIGGLPSGVTLSPTGLLSGTPSTSATSTFTIEASNGVSPAADQDFTLNVLDSPSATVISVSPASVTSGNTASFSATVSSPFDVPTGSVNFTTENTNLCTASLVNGTGTCESNSEPIGTDTITGTYSGDSSHASSTGTAVLSVIPPPCPTGATHLAAGEPWAVAAMSTTVEGRNCPGYWVVTRTGGVTSIGSAPWLGDMSGHRLNAPVVGITATPTGKGYYLLGGDGGIFTFGDATFHGSTGGTHLNAPVVAMAVTPSGDGYWFSASDGGIFTFGDAHFYGSTGSIRLNKPVVGMAATATSAGYWLVASDGGIFTFGDAHFFGSTGGTRLNQPVVGMTAQRDGGGYRLVASDGGVFDFGNAAYYGSLPQEGVKNPDVTTMASSADGNGYYLINAAGTVWAFGDAPYLGNA